jgi:filamentous hemagglutinin family protein
MRHIESARLRVSAARKVKLNHWGMTLCATMVGLSTVMSLAQPAPNARPTGGSVVAGQASISMSPGVVNITSTTLQAVINWQSFDIGSRQQVVFTGPSADAVILNRVTGPDPSQIAGTLSSNGQVYLANASGVTYYKGAELEVDGLVATSAGISNQNFINNRLLFDQPGNPAAKVENRGEISVSTGGALAFVAPIVANSGVIRVPRGSVVLGSARTFTLDPNSDLLSLNVSDQLTSAIPSDPVVNTGVIRARGGSVQLTARAVDSLVGPIRVGGVIRAKTANTQLGAIVVSSIGVGAIVEGTLDASGEKGSDLGGNVQVLSNGSAELGATSLVDVSGEAGGGTVAIGTTLARAKGGPGTASTVTSNTVILDQGAQITADALAAGNGGRVVVLATTTTNMMGSISARGGDPSGNGGFVEISGANLGLNGTVDVGAQFGPPGIILLDPYDFTIIQPIAEALAAQLSEGRSGKLIIQADHDIVVDAVIDGRGGMPGTQLMLKAGNQVRLNASVFTNNGPIEIDAGPGSILPAPGTVLCAGTSSITVTSAGGLFGNGSGRPTSSKAPIPLTALSRC